MRFVVFTPFPFDILTGIPQATYLRLILSMANDRPASCNRVVNGSISYVVLGWSAVLAEVGFLMPMTFLNISALIIIIMAIVMARGDAHDYDPASVRHLLATQVDETVELEWTDTVRCRRGEVSDCHIFIQCLF